MVRLARLIQCLHQSKLIYAAARNDWHLPQIVPESETISLTPAQYGFLDAYSGYFSHVAMTENEVNELGPDGERLTLRERREKRIAHENDKWDEEYYL